MVLNVVCAMHVLQVSACKNVVFPRYHKILLEERVK
jgi:hypothetical protein